MLLDLGHVMFCFFPSISSDQDILMRSRVKNVTWGVPFDASLS